MSVTGKILRELCKDIEPSKSQKAIAARSQISLRNKINSGNMEICYIDSFLIGSYARGTAIYPIDDVDIVMIVDPDFWKRSWLQQQPDPEQVVTTLHRAIKRRYRSSSVRKQNRSVGLIMSRINIDVVPAIETDEEGIILIPDRKQKKWIKTAPTAHRKVVSNINSSSNGLFVPLVKLLKFWNTGLPSGSQLKSFAIETIAARLFLDYSLTSIEQGVLYFFDFIVHKSSGVFGPKPYIKWDDGNDSGEISLGVLPYALDVAGINKNILTGVNKKNLTKFCDNALRCRDKFLLINESSTDSYVKKQVASIFKVEFHSSRKQSAQR